MAKTDPRAGRLRVAAPPAALLTFAVGATTPTGGEVRDLLEPYRDDSGYRCPACGERVRVLDGPPARIIGCHGGALTRLAGQAAAAPSTRPPEGDTE